VYPWSENQPEKRKNETLSYAFAFIALMLAVSLACGIDFGNSTPAASEPSQPPADNTNAGMPPRTPPVKYFTEEFDGGYDDWSKSIV